MLLAHLLIGDSLLENDFSFLTDVENSGNQEPEFIQKIRDYDMDENLKKFIMDCLEILPENRPFLADLLQSSFLKNMQVSKTVGSKWPIMAHCFDNSLKAQDVFYLSQVRDREMEGGFARQIHDIHLPLIVRLDDDLDSILNDFSSSVSLPIFLEEVKLEVSDLLEETNVSAKEYKVWNRIGDWDFNGIDDSIKLFAKREKLDLEWRRKERDITFQRMRVQLFRNLLIRFPLSMEKILFESAGGFPSHLRASVYCALLHTTGDTSIIFDVLNCDLSTSMDLQVRMFTLK
jgi:serine/threonine protein kinase